MLSRFFRRHRRRDRSSHGTNNSRDTEVPSIHDDIENQILAPVEDDNTRRDDHQARRGGGTHSDRALLLMAQNHMIAFVIILYGIYIICRLLGWKPGVKSTTYTIYFGHDS